MAALTVEEPVAACMSMATAAAVLPMSERLVTS
jgi:hypothetical protein